MMMRREDGPNLVAKGDHCTYRASPAHHGVNGGAAIKLSNTQGIVAGASRVGARLARYCAYSGRGWAFDSNDPSKMTGVSVYGTSKIPNLRFLGALAKNTPDRLESIWYYFTVMVSKTGQCTTNLDCSGFGKPLSILHCLHAFARVFMVLALSVSICKAQSASELLSQADHLAGQGNWAAAVPLYEKAQGAFHRSGDIRNELYAKIGRLHKDVEQGAYRATRVELERDLTSPVVQSDPELRIRALALKGLIDLNVNTNAASDDWNEVLRLSTSLVDRKWENRAKGELALVAGVKGQLGVAALGLYKALNTATQLGDIDAQVNFATWLGNGMAVHGMADRAILMLDKVITFIRENGYVLPLQLQIAKVRALVLLPEPQRAKERATAKQLIAQGMDQARKDNVPGAQTELLNLTAEIALDEDDRAAAVRSFETSARIAGQAGLPRMQAEALLRLTQVHMLQKQPAVAAISVEHAIRVLQTAEEPFDLPIYIGEKARVQAALQNYKASEQLYEQATELIDGLLVNAFSSRAKSAMIGALSDIYLGEFRFALNDLHDPAKAFRIIESARGRALVDSLRYGSHAESTTPQEMKAEREIARLQAALLHRNMTYAKTRRVLAQLDDAYDRLAPIEFSRNRKEMQLARPSPVDPAALRGKLESGEALIEYVTDVEDSYALVVTRDGIVVRTLAARARIANLVDEYLKAVRAKRDSTPSARALFRAVVQPVLVPNISSITFVPDGPLHLIPFDALVKDDGSYLFTDVEVSTAPSATAFCALKARTHAAAKKPFLGVAYSPPQGEPHMVASSARGMFDGQSWALQPLPFAYEEVSEAAEVAGGESVVLSGASASEATLKLKHLDEFRVIHIAAHAIGDVEDPDREALVLSPGSNSEDGLWQAREIRRTALNADLVVLSACETGTGRLQGEEGVMNLARTFLIAGATSAVASLWSVDDRSTATLMTYFYRHLADHMTVAGSLRRAKLDFIKEYGEKAKPYYWAAFVVIGDGTRKIPFTTNNPQPGSARMGL